MALSIVIDHFVFNSSQILDHVNDILLGLLEESYQLPVGLRKG